MFQYPEFSLIISNTYNFLMETLIRERAKINNKLRIIKKNDMFKKNNMWFFSRKSQSFHKQQNTYLI